MQKYLDYVINQDISNNPKLELPDSTNTFDCIIFGDVLEHLANPLEVIRCLSTLLKDTGIVLACIPNVQHWSAIYNLIVGEWPEQDSGLFDRTHLKWFTYKSIIKLFIDADLNIYQIKPRIFNGNKAVDFVEALKPALQNLGISPQDLLQKTAPLQYVVKAGLKRRIALIYVVACSNRCLND